MAKIQESEKTNPFKTVGLVLLFALLCIVLFPIALAYLVEEIYLRFRLQSAFSSQGKFVLFVYSNSPNWKIYIENRMLPVIGEHAIILNWSERSEWKGKKSWPVRAFKHWGGGREFNPLAIVFCRLTKVETIRFYQAFRDFKHGKEAPLRKAESRLYELVKVQTETPQARTD